MKSLIRDHAMALTGRKLEELAGLIGSAYTFQQLEVLLDVRLELKLYNLISRGLTDDDARHHLIVKLDQLGRVDDLVTAIKVTRPGRPDIQAFHFTRPGTNPVLSSESPLVADAAPRMDVVPSASIPGPEKFINALCQLTAGEFDAIVLFLGILQADIGGADLRGRAVSVYERVNRPGRKREQNLLRLKGEIERLYPDAFTSGTE